jgi:hypothetical protein
VTRTQLQWYPTVMHDLHEAQTYLYSSTGTGPYNDALDPIVVSEWWTMAQNDVMEMTKAACPACDLRLLRRLVPNYMFFIAHRTRIGRFQRAEPRPGSA